MKIVFWGTPKYAADNLVHIIKSGFDVVAAVTQPDKKRNRGKHLSPSPVKQTALDFGIPVYTTPSIRKDENIKNILFNLRADIYIVVAFGQILPREILDKPNLGCWNSHASLLPAWRGAAPIQWSIMNNDAMTGVCIMAMEEGLDTGPVIEQETTIIKDSDNLETLTNRLANISSKLLVNSLQKIYLTNGLDKSSRLKRLKAIEQSSFNVNPSYARQIRKEDYLIDWNQKAWKILKKINGLYPNAYTFYNGKRIKILEASLLDNRDNHSESINIVNEKMKSSIPGEIILINKLDGIIVMANDYPILIKFGKLEGKKKADSLTLSVQSKLLINGILGN